LGLEGGEIFVGLGFGWQFGEFCGEFPLEFLEVELELAQFGFGFVAILFVGAEFFVEDDYRGYWGGILGKSPLLIHSRIR
jgi:hypothetical protein